MNAMQGRRGATGEPLFSIGEASRRAGVSQKTLRYYAKIGLVVPDVVEESGYRYYSIETMLRIPVINYLKMMGFTLEEITAVIDAGGLGEIRDFLTNRADACRAEERRVHERQRTIEDWVDLIDEANYVLSHRTTVVGVKYLSAQNCLSMPYRFWGSYADTTINPSFTALVTDRDNVISGPVMMWREEVRDGVDVGARSDVLILQRALRTVEPRDLFVRKAGLYVSTYHVGSFDGLGEAYGCALDYARRESLELEGGAIERFVTDYWSSQDSGLFVTELLLPVVPS